MRAKIEQKIERRWAALTGLVGAGPGLALAEVTALIIAPQSSPVLAIGALAIDLAPPWVKDAVIGVFGTGDKVFLISLLLVALTVVVTTRAQSTWLWAAPTVIGMLGAALLLRAAIRRLREWSAAEPTDNADALPTRRRFLTLVVGTAAAAIVVGIGARIPNAATLAVGAVRAAITLPKPVRAAAPIPAASALARCGWSSRACTATSPPPSG